ncbi:MAG TPA: DapH/DapD/GlmU-related protein [Magnetospirillaceae bacterium]|nr:DapH/DapD/GlmU-related protein [Magnetospirillaceae bacterium]
MNILSLYTPHIAELISDVSSDIEPWELIDQLPEILTKLSTELGEEYEIKGTTFIHRTAKVHPTAILQDIVIVEANASVGPHAMLRNGVWLGQGAHIGGSDEIKQSIIGSNSTVAHLNYVGNSIIGDDVNIEAGAVLANHHNDCDDKSVWVLIDGEKIKTDVKKFGALVGDHSRIGANAVTAPGTILKPATIVNRLELVLQIPA